MKDLKRKKTCSYRGFKFFKNINLQGKERGTVTK